MSERNKYEYGKVSKKYEQKSIKQRLEAFFLDNVGKIVSREMLIEVSKDPKSGQEPENWHQRLSELRTDDGYTILSKRDKAFLSVEEYILESLVKRDKAGKRVMPTKETWTKVLERANNSCEWKSGSEHCRLGEGQLDSVGGGTVKLTADHMSPHSINPDADPNSIDQWQALCGRHQVIKKNFWDSSSGKINTLAVLQALPHSEKEIALDFLLRYFGKS